MTINSKTKLHKLCRLSKILLAAAMILMLAACSSGNKKADPGTSSDTSTDSGTGSGTAVVLSLDGTSITDLPQFGEKLTVLNVWATWCPPCIRELPHLQKLSEYYADKGVAVIGVMQDGVTEMFEPNEEVIDSGVTLLDDAGAQYLNILPDHDFFTQFIASMQVFPTTYFLDSEGNILSVETGSRDFDGWKVIVDDALDQFS